MLSPALASAALARRRFEREARAAAAVCHEHVVTIHAVDEHAGNPYLVMQFVAGQSLQEGESTAMQRPRRRGVSYESALQKSRRAWRLRTLRGASAPGHQACEPAAGERSRTGQDFHRFRPGPCHRRCQYHRERRGPRNAALYMSPEQALGRGGRPPHRSLFSLGSVLFATCTGQPPFRAESSGLAVLAQGQRRSPAFDPQSFQPRCVARMAGGDCRQAGWPRTQLRQVPFGERGGRAARPARRPTRAAGRWRSRSNRCALRPPAGEE